MKHFFLFILALCSLLFNGCGASDTVDREPPEVKILPPEKDDVGAPIIISVEATDNVSVNGVTLYIDGAFLERKTRPPYTFFWYSDYWGDGNEHLISASASDPTGNTALSKTVSVDVLKMRKPTVEIITPLNNAVLPEPRVTLRWTPIENTTSYTVQLSDTILTDEFLIADVKTPESSVTIELPAEKTYRWRVLPATIGNRFGGWSNESIFHRTDQFTTLFGTRYFDALNAAALTRDGGMIIAGSTHSLEKGGLLIKVDRSGRKKWQRIYGGIDISWFSTVIQTQDGGFLAAGQNTSKDSPSDRWFIKTDAEGNLEWSKTILLPGSQGVNSIFQTEDGGYVICGFTDTDSSRIDIVLTKVDAEFETIWENRFGGLFHDEAFHITPASDGGILIAGFKQAGTEYSSDRAMVKRLNVLGEEKWTAELRSPGGARFVSGVEHRGKFYVCGTTKSIENRQNALVAAYDSAGNYLWTRTFGADRGDNATGITVWNDRLAVCGSAVSDSLGIQDAWLLVLNLNGDELFSKTYGGKNYDGATGITAFLNGYALIGTTASYTSGSSDGFLILTDGAGNVKHFAP